MLLGLTTSYQKTAMETDGNGCHCKYSPSITNNNVAGRWRTAEFRHWASQVLGLFFYHIMLNRLSVLKHICVSQKNAALKKVIYDIRHLHTRQSRTWHVWYVYIYNSNAYFFPVLACRVKRHKYYRWIYYAILYADKYNPTAQLDIICIM